VLEGEPERVERLAANAALLRRELSGQGLDPGSSQTQIIPLVLGDADLAVAVCEAALDRGVFAQAIRPPTVPAGTSRLRLALSSSHRDAELRAAARALGAAVRACAGRGADRPTLTAASWGDVARHAAGQVRLSAR
jgi:7-keto-8-aminopelargonate synthetase-like enzyme